MEMMQQSCFDKNLDCGWLIAVDQDNCGKTAGWADAVQPGAVQAVFPGMISDSIDSFTRGVAWYWNRFDADAPLDPGCEYFIQAGYTEWIAEYWLNGIYVGSFTGVNLNYELDVTGALKEKDNLLAIRVVSPTPDGIDGYHFGSLPADPNAAKMEQMFVPNNIVASARNNNSQYGGILYPMHVTARPRVRSGRVVIKSDWQSGCFSVNDTWINHTDADVSASVCLKILASGGECVWTEEKAVLLPVGETQGVLNGCLPAFHLWDIDSPYLYTALVTILVGGEVAHVSQTRFGFRDFRVKDGYFCLNGRRIFLKCANSSLERPSWSIGPWEKQSLRNEMLRTKAMGHNALRYLCTNLLPEILDLCDEIGLMVFDEHAASWLMDGGNPYFEEQFLFHARGVLRRDINHPCFTMFGLINESHCQRERECAFRALKPLREEDDSRLILLGSGRWDADYTVGSVSNPGSLEWECVWGAEDPVSPRYQGEKMCGYGREDLTQYGGNWGRREDELTCWAPGQGDTHIYPRWPMTERAIDILRTHCKDLKPAFLSEGSHTSMGNPMRMFRKAEEHGVGGSETYRWLDRRRMEYFAKDFARYGMDDLFGVPEDVPYASYAINAKQRSLFFDCVRSNPKYCGLCYTMCVDLGSGAGMIPFERDEYKPFMCDTVADAFAPLHWCVFVNPSHVYAGQPFTVEAVLANEDVLGPGRYPVTARIVSREYGKVWEYKTEAVIPETPAGSYPSFTVPVLKETVTIDKPEGTYELTVYLEKGGAPTGGRKTIPVSVKKPLQNRRCAMIGLPENVKAWLAESGVCEDPASPLILIGQMPDDDAAWAQLYEKVENGASAVILCPEVLLKGVKDPFDYNEYVPERLPFANKGKLTYADNWHYHTFGMVKAHPYTAAMPKGLIDDEYYMLTTPEFVFFGQDTPDEIATLTVGLPYFTHETEGTDGYLCGVSLGTYRLGKGRLVLNCFKLFDLYGDSDSHANLGRNPAADRLLLNIIDHESDCVPADAAKAE